MSEQSDPTPIPSWIQYLPTYDGLFPTSTPAAPPSLTRSFSLFSLFRRPSSTSLTQTNTPPSTDLLQPLINLPRDPLPTPQQVKGALSNLQIYINQLKAYLIRSDTVNVEDLDGERLKELGDLLIAYPQGFQAAAQVTWSEGISHGDLHTVRRSLEISLSGAFRLYSLLSSLDDLSSLQGPLGALRQTLLGSIFPDTTSHLTPLFTRSRDILQSLQTANRPLAHAKSISRGSPAPSTVVAANDAVEIMSLLELFAEQCHSIPILPGVAPSKTKAQKEEDKRRPLRIALEATVVRCDVALSMANRDIKAIKERAVNSTKVPEREESDEEDNKPKLDTMGVAGADGGEEGLSQLKWEEIAETALIGCLEVAKGLMEERRGGVLSDKVEREDWLGEEYPIKTEDSINRRSLSLNDANPEREKPDDESEPDSEDEGDEDDHESVSETPDDIYPSPLRTIFRLHDRYEEQRLAVWLSIKVSVRGPMGSYMRGEGGRVGEVWDALGLLLLLDYDSETLLNHGLSGEKLDKWVELASKRNAKKIRRKGRKTV